MTNRLIIGTAQMGMKYGVNNQRGVIPKEEAFKILDYCKKSGIHTIDTAEIYGSAHQLIGDYHKHHTAPLFEVITKIPNDLPVQDLYNRTIKYLDEIQIKELDTLLFHSFESYKKHMTQIDVINRLKDEGVVRNIGISIYTNQEFETVISDWNIDVIQFPFNLLDNYSRRGDLMVKAKEKGKILHSRSVFLQGLFFKKLDINNPVGLKLKSELNDIQELSQQWDLELGKMALSYVLSHDIIDKVLIGVDSLIQLKQNVSGSKYLMNEELKKRINHIRISNGDLINPSLW